MAIETLRRYLITGHFCNPSSDENTEVPYSIDGENIGGNSEESDSQLETEAKGWIFWSQPVS